MTRKQRARRLKKALRVEITERDGEMLTLVGLVRYISAEQIAREFFPSEDRCRRRLRQLFDAGFIKINLTASNKPNLISLTASGRELVLLHRPDLENSIQSSGVIKLSGIAHHLTLAETRLYLANLAQTENGQLLRWESGRGALAEQIGISEYYIVPDALAEIQIRSELLRFAIEADCATEGSQMLERKLRGYQKVMTGGLVDEVWIIMQEGQSRKVAIKNLVQQNRLAEFTRIMSVSYISIRPVQKPLLRVGVKMKNKIHYSASSDSLINPSFQEVRNIYPAADRRAERTG